MLTKEATQISVDVETLENQYHSFSAFKSLFQVRNKLSSDHFCQNTVSKNE